MSARTLKRILVCFIILGLTIYIYTYIYISARVYFDNKKTSDTIIVLGAKSFVNGRVNECVKARVQHAADLYADGFASKIIMSGGTDKQPLFLDTNEAEEMKKIALSLDVEINPEDILLEGESTSTYENLLYSQNLMKRNSLNSAIIVTEPFHSPRAGLVAKKLNMNYTLSPTLTSPCWNRWKYFSRYFLREPVVIFGYKLFNQI